MNQPVLRNWLLVAATILVLAAIMAVMADEDGMRTLQDAARRAAQRNAVSAPSGSGEAPQVAVAVGGGSDQGAPVAIPTAEVRPATDEELIDRAEGIDPSQDREPQAAPPAIAPE